MGDRNDFPATPSEMAHSGQLRIIPLTPPINLILRFIRTGFLQNPNHLLVSKSLLRLKLEAKPIPNTESGVL